MDTLTEVMASLSPKTKARVRAASDVTVEKLPLPSIGLNRALRGGVGFGRQTLIWGNKSAGKSSLCLETIGRAQKDGKVCAFIDSESSFDPSWATELGVDTSQLIVSPVKTVMDMVDVGTELMHAGVDVIVVDSISSLLPSSWFEKKGDELKGLEGTKQIGSDSRDMSNAVRMLNYANEKTALILISQIRNQITTYGASGKPTGGNGVLFFSSTSIKLTSTARADAQINGEIVVNNKILNMPIGRPVDWIVDYNKIGPPNQVGKYNFFYGGESIGVDNYGEIVDIAETLGLVEKGGAWYTLYGEKFQGAAKVAKHLKDNKEIFDKLVAEIEQV